ncbi:MAG: hypothetical protein R3B82_29525 [Sandaracinaceae bacterium]
MAFDDVSRELDAELVLSGDDGPEEKTFRFIDSRESIEAFFSGRTDALPDLPVGGLIVAVGLGPRQSTGWIAEPVMCVQHIIGISAGTIQMSYRASRPDDPGPEVMTYPWAFFRVTGTEWATGLIVGEVTRPQPTDAATAGFPIPYGHRRGGGAELPEGSSCPDWQGDLAGRRLRVYRTGDAIDMGYFPDRFNIELDPVSARIVQVWFG